MKFREFEVSCSDGTSGGKVIVNADTITYVSQDTFGCTAISFAEGEWVRVTATHEEVRDWLLGL